MTDETLYACLRLFKAKFKAVDHKIQSCRPQNSCRPQSSCRPQNLKLTLTKL